MIRLVSLLLALVPGIFLSASAQDSRYLVEFKDKKGTAFTLTNPAAYLSAKAIARRTTQNIPIDSTDLPVSAAYFDSIRLVPNVTILNRSKWLNQVAIKITSQAALTKINSFPFVKSVSSLGARFSTGYMITGSKLERNIKTATTLSAKVQANIYNYGTSLNQVHIHNGEYLHNLQFNGSGVTIAVLDAGFSGYKTNPAFDSLRLQNRMLGEWDFVNNETNVNEDDAHGMYCLSIMTGNRTGLLVGSAPKASFYLYRTEDNGSEYPIEEQNWVAGAERADSAGADMISSSLGYSDFDNPAFNHSYLQRNGNFSVVTRGADLAAKKGMIVMNSAGNSGAEGGEGKFVACPADGDSVMTVGSVDAVGRISAFSSWGPNGASKLKPNVVSMGSGTAIAGLNGEPASGSGTSFSNPNMAGLIACLWQAFPESSNMQIIDAVQRSADRANAPDARFGYGLPDFKKAFAYLLIKNFSGSIALQSCSAVISWKGKDNNQIKYEVQRRTPSDTGFITIATIPGKSTGFQKNEYLFNENLATASFLSARYRIRETIPGDSTMIVLDSTINIPGTCKTTEGISVSPNPFRTSIGVSINLANPPPRYTISLYSSTGQKVYERVVSNPGTTMSIQIPAGTLPKGVYALTVRDDRKILETRQVLK